MFFSLITMLAYAAMDIDSTYTTTIRKDVPVCSGDYECTKAIDVQRAQVKREVRAEIKQKDYCSNEARVFGGQKGELKSVYVSEINAVPDGSQFIYYATAKVVCTIYQN